MMNLNKQQSNISKNHRNAQQFDSHESYSSYRSQMSPIIQNQDTQTYMNESQQRQKKQCKNQSTFTLSGQDFVQNLKRYKFFILIVLLCIVILQYWSYSQNKQLTKINRQVQQLKLSLDVFQSKVKQESTKENQNSQLVNENGKNIQKQIKQILQQIKKIKHQSKQITKKEKQIKDQIKKSDNQNKKIKQNVQKYKKKNEQMSKNISDLKKIIESQKNQNNNSQKKQNKPNQKKQNQNNQKTFPKCSYNQITSKFRQSIFFVQYDQENLDQKGLQQLNHMQQQCGFASLTEQDLNKYIQIWNKKPQNPKIVLSKLSKEERRNLLIFLRFYNNAGQYFHANLNIKKVQERCSTRSNIGEQILFSQYTRVTNTQIYVPSEKFTYLKNDKPESPMVKQIINNILSKKKKIFQMCQNRQCLIIPCLIP